MSAMCRTSRRRWVAPRVLVPVIMLSAGLSTGALGQGQPAQTLQTHPMSFWSGAVSFTTHEITLPVASMTAEVDSAEAKARKEVRFRLSGDVLFDFDEAEIRPEAEVILADLAKKIREDFAGAPVRVEGHTDAKGSESYNQTLSQRRAESVKRWFVDTGGMPSGQIHTQGFGEKRPVAPNTDPDGTDNPRGRQQNRRVEIVVERPG